MNKFIFLIAILLTCNIALAQKQPKALALATADSTNFSVNSRAGWQLFNSYVVPINTDSATIEIIIQHDRTIDFTQEQLVGYIKRKESFPKANQNVSFSLISDVYQLRIDPNGRCYLRLTTGSLPDGDPVIIPVRAVYKR